MLPKRLTIQGLYSYQQKQTIDFTELTQAGIFGIFGAVGSGKSSILEAIGFALYGKTERLNVQENRNYNMMNLKSSELLIDFEFEHYDSTVYRFTVKGKRNSKKFEEVKTLERNAYKWFDNNWSPLESSDAAQLLDLSYENFRRTIIIPQGKFQEFLQLGGKDRTQMMMEIFHLHKYDLSSKVSFLEKENDLKIAHLEGELNQLIQNIEEDLIEKKELLSELQNNYNISFSELTKKEQNFQELNKIKELFENKKTYEQQVVALQSDKQKFEEKEKEIGAYEIAKSIFEPLFLRRKALQSVILKRKESLNALTINYSSITNVLSNKTKEWGLIKQDYNNLDQWRIIIQDYEIALAFLQTQEKIKSFEEKCIFTEKNISEEEKTKTDLSGKITQLQQNLQSIKEQQPDNIFVFNAIAEWFQKKNNTINKIKEAEEKKSILEERISKGKSLFSTLSFDYEKWSVQYETQKEQHLSRLSLLQEQKIKISAKEELHKYAHNLINGEPCPLCGSLHHPQTLTDNHEIKKEIEELELEIIQTTTQLESLENNGKKASQYDYSIQSFEEQINTLNAEILKEQNVLVIHNKTFIWEGFNPNNEADFYSKRQNAEKNISTINDLELKISTEQALLEKSKDQLNKFLQLHTENKAQLKAATENAQILEEKLISINKDQVTQLKKENIQQLKSELIEKTKLTTQQYESLQKEIQDLDKEKSIVENSIQNLNHEKEIETKEIESLTTQIQDTFKEHQIEKEDLIIERLKNPIDISKERKSITDFHNQLFAAELQLKQIQLLLEGKDLDISEWENVKQQIEKDKDNISLLTAEIAKCKQTIDLLTDNLERKKKLTTEWNKKILRKENIQTLKTLFSGSGFVNYISSVYLKNLCNAANYRFSKLTRNQLHIELNANNEFVVRDLLNDGKTRSIKTLSGGQTFQASLCLALALADSIQYQNRSEQNFFFLDEGFGSLDKESLTTIYETLKGLRKEKRIVGIISHVEDLQQEIPLSILVKNDIEHGSSIQLISN